MAVIFYLSSQPDPLPELTAAVWDKALHFLEYAGLAVLLVRAFRGEGIAFRHAFSDGHVDAAGIHDEFRRMKTAKQHFVGELVKTKSADELRLMAVSSSGTKWS